MGFTFAVGDIHGCHDQLRQLLDTLETSWSGGTVVFLGDYVDRGPKSKDVVECLMAGPTKPGWTWIALKGNHEELMVSALEHGSRYPFWYENGGEEALASYAGAVPQSALAWMNDRPLIHHDQHRIFVHAGVDEALPLDRQTPHTLLWSRPLPDSSGSYWGRHLCHGHTPAPDNPVTIGNRTNIDSGCVFGGQLTAAVFDDAIAGPPIKFITIAHRG